MGTVCTIHGKQEGLSCEECDKKAPADVLEARNIVPSNPSGSGDAFDKAVAAAVKKELAANKGSAQGKEPSIINDIPVDQRKPKKSAAAAKKKKAA